MPRKPTKLLCPVTRDEVEVVELQGETNHCFLRVPRYWKSKLFGSKAAATRWLNNTADFTQSAIEVLTVKLDAAGHEVEGYTVRSSSGWTGDFVLRTTAKNALYRILTPGMKPPDHVDVQVIGVKSVVDEFGMEPEEDTSNIESMSDIDDVISDAKRMKAEQEAEG